MSKEVYKEEYSVQVTVEVSYRDVEDITYLAALLNMEDICFTDKLTAMFKYWIEQTLNHVGQGDQVAKAVRDHIDNWLRLDKEEK